MFKVFWTSTIIVASAMANLAATPNAPRGLMVGEGAVNPLGYHDSAPRFSWKLEDDRFGALQTAYRVQVFDSPEMQRLYWDSGKRISDQSVYVECESSEFASRDTLYWRVRYWDQNEERSPWSEWARVEYGLLSNEEWKASWIHQPKMKDLSGIEITKATYGRGPFSIDITEAFLSEIAENPNQLFKMRVGEGELFERKKRTGTPMALTLHYKRGGETLECLNWDGQLIEIPPQALCNVPYFRKEFKVDEKPAKARLYVTARGIFEVEINGKKVGQDAFTPGWTDYFQRIETLTYDVTEYLNTGDNVIGVRLAKGWYAGEVGPGIGKKGPSDVNRGLGGQIPELLCQLEVGLESGEVSTIVSDGTWQYCDKGSIVKSEIYWGEDYDARLEMPGWSTPGSAYSSFKEVEAAPLGDVSLRPKSFQSVSVQKVLKPVSITEVEAGRTIFDMGQNMVGWPVVEIPVKAGKLVTIRVAEMLEQDGALYIENYRNSRSIATYVPAKDGVIRWQPTFTFFGYRYVEISGYDEEWQSATSWLEGHVLHSGFPQTGKFVSSNTKLNQLQNNIEWGQRGNFLDIPTDCPQRNERLGWTGDAQVFSATSLYNFDVHAFWKSWLHTLRGHQTKDGRLPVVVPNVGTFVGGPVLSPAWGDAIAIVPWEIYLQTGDLSVLEENYEAMSRYVELYRSRSKDYLGPDVGFGDWLQPIQKEWKVNPNNSNFGSTPRPLLATAFFGYSSSICAKSAALLGKEDEAKFYRDTVGKIKASVRKNFLDENGRLTTAEETQTGYVVLLAFDLVEEELRPKLGRHLVNLVRKENGRLNTGFVGTSYLNRVLDDLGYAKDAMGTLFTSEYPSWFYSIEQGATTIWERWNSYSHEDGFGDANMNSFNHYAYGAIGRWMYERLAGLAPEESQPGYKHILVEPIFESPLDFAEAQLKTRYGEAKTKWQKLENGIALNVTIPPNATATVSLPKRQVLSVEWTNAPKGKELTFYTKKGKLHTRLDAGNYEFLLRQ